MKQYKVLLNHVLTQGVAKGDRTGTGTRSVFGYQMRFDLNQGFPLATTKKIHFKSIIHELLWFLSGDTNIKYLNDNGVRIWDMWANSEGDLGPIYGQQWRKWIDPHTFKEIDQIEEVLHQIKTNPDSRRIVVSAWNVSDLPSEYRSPQENAHWGRMALAPCHCLFQFYVSQGKLSCQLYQRSADVFLGVPFNIASYALLTHMMAAQTGLQVGDLVWTGGDVHLYNNHVEQAIEQLTREPYKLPELGLNAAVDSLFDYKAKDINLIQYDHYPPIKAPISI